MSLWAFPNNGIELKSFKAGSYHHSVPEVRPSARVKSFGRREAYESLRGRNPRAAAETYGDLAFRLASRMPELRSGMGQHGDCGPYRRPFLQFSESKPW